MFRSLFALSLGAFLFVAPAFSYAQTPTCTIYYGGGETDCKATASATITAAPTPSRVEQGTPPPTTKGGQEVYTPAAMTETPATGPEALALAALIPAAAAGLYLQKKKI